MKNHFDFIVRFLQKFHFNKSMEKEGVEGDTGKSEITSDVIESKRLESINDCFFVARNEGMPWTGNRLQAKLGNEQQFDSVHP